MKKYKLGIWNGDGYLLEPFEVAAPSQEEALERLLSRLQREDRFDLFLSPESVEAAGLTEEEKEEMYLYIDPSLSDRDAVPAYIRKENLEISEL